LDNYDTPGATDAVLVFFANLNNWYIRRNKERFWSAEKTANKQAAYDTLYTVLVTLCEAAAPLLPLTLDAVYKGLTEKESVHLANFPNVEEIENTDELLDPMWWTMEVCTAALAVRNKINIRVRQPLASLLVVSQKADDGAKKYFEPPHVHGRLVIMGPTLN